MKRWLAFSLLLLTPPWVQAATTGSPDFEEFTIDPASPQGVTGWTILLPVPQSISEQVFYTLSFDSPFQLPSHPTSGTPIFDMTPSGPFSGGGTGRVLAYVVYEGPPDTAGRSALVHWSFPHDQTSKAEDAATLHTDQPIITHGELAVDFYERREGQRVQVGSYDQTADLYGYRTADALERARREQTGPMATPEPGSLMLFGSGLAGVAGMAWKRRRKTL
jgi:hypothetical protein